MAALLIVGVIAVLVLVYAADRIRQARSRARLLHAMNDRLTVAAAQIDQEQERRRAAALASAQLTSVLPAIKRPPLTLPGVPGPEPEPVAGDEPASGTTAGPEPAAEPGDAEPGDAEPGDAEPGGGTGGRGGPARGGPARGGGGGGRRGGGARAAAPQPAPSVQAAGQYADGPEPDDGSEPATPAADSAPAASTPGESTLPMPGGLEEPGEEPVPRLRLTAAGTLIMPQVQVPGGSVAAGPSRPAASGLKPGEPGGS